MTFLDSILGRVGILVAGVALAFLAGYLRGHNVGWDKAVARDKVVVTACLDANHGLERTIEQLQQANQDFAAAASVSKAEQERAAQVVADQARASAQALKAADKKLAEALRAPDAATWSATRVPAGVVSAINH